MAKHDRLAPAQLVQRVVQQARLRGWRPDGGARTFALAEAGPVEGDHAVMAGRAVEQAAGVEIFGQDAVTME